MKEIKLIIPGKPIAKHRPRFARRGKFVVTYSDQETEEGRFLWELKNQWKQEPLEGPIQVRAFFYMPIPASAPKKQKAQMELVEPPHIKKPDLDNCVKFLKDCCNQVIWHDDSQVCRLYASKAYSAKPRTEMFGEMEEIGGAQNVTAIAIRVPGTSREPI